MPKPKSDGLDELIASFPEASVFLEERIGSVSSEGRAAPLPTGSVSLDIMTGGGISGLVEVFGSASSGKTALVAMMMSHCQRSGIPVALVPTEWLDLPYLTTLGVNISVLPILRQEAEMADFLRTFPRSMIVIDSITGYQPPAHKLENWNEYIWGLLKGLSCLLGPGSGIVMTSQVRRMKVRGRIQSPIESASRRLTDLFDFRLFLNRTDGPEDTYTVRVSAVANAGAPPSTFIDLPGIKGSGILAELDMLRVAVSLEVVDRTEGGAWYHYRGVRLGQGEAKALQTMTSDKTLKAAITRDVLRRCAEG